MQTISPKHAINLYPIGVNATQPDAGQTQAGVQSQEIVTIAGKPITRTFNTWKDQPISVVCGRCNTRVYTEVRKVVSCCGCGGDRRHFCQNCGARIAYIREDASCCTIF